MKLSPVVNFIKILQAFDKNLQSQKVNRELLRKTLSNVKFLSKMLMKLSPAVNFITNRSTRACQSKFVQYRGHFSRTLFVIITN